MRASTLVFFILSAPRGVLLVGGRPLQWLMAQWQATFFTEMVYKFHFALTPQSSTLFWIAPHGKLKKKKKKKKELKSSSRSNNSSQFLRFHVEPNLTTILKNKG